MARDTSRDHAAELAERARQRVCERPFDLGDGRRIEVTCSVGFAAFPLSPKHPRALDWATVVGLADEALYVVKRGGRDGWHGILEAPQGDELDLRRHAGEPLADWLASGELTTVRSASLSDREPEGKD